MVRERQTVLLQMQVPHNGMAEQALRRDEPIDVMALPARTKRFTCPEKPLDSLRALVRESAIAQDASLPPMAAGVFGYLGYDMVREMERLPAAKPDPIGW